ncbi:two-component system chemotaxis sensor kinase CheA [Sphingomonas naasensis]|uniref:Chemotaxis protein CheA n=1 Tax=Sphingomonas naasensis TaxID=1344951 RepID=A0A4S1WJ29_9SPHN|nr:chemotaxis protein CheA [Sphingomonas naasensis]NIJ20788.1 two-component system chemotaxis sensor kinase CheA [Sphingomonas naasensis]TGX43194.1 chemotaxis protein CheA [Sphingomonas naasensis]
MSDELDEIQAIFFEECTEGLTTAEQGLSAMQAGDVSAETIAGVFRAVHSIKGGAGAFGHADLTAFAHKFENVLDEVRAGKIAPTPGVVKVMLSSFDVLSDHVETAKGLAPRPNDAAALAALEKVLADKGADDGAAVPAAPAPAPAPAPVAAAPAAPAEDEFGFTPVAFSLDDFDTPAAPAASTASWTIRFKPSRAALANAGEPLLIIRELETLGATIEAVDVSDVPGLRDLDPEDAYFTWTLSMPGDVPQSDINDCFDFVAPDSLIEVTRNEVEAPAPAFIPVPVIEVTPAPEAAAAPEIDLIPFVPVTATIEDLTAQVQQVVADLAAAPMTPTPAPAPTETAAPKPASEASQTIRVDLSKLDLLLNLVGELVIRNSILADRLSPADRQRVELPELARLTRQIQDNVMSLRAQPIKQAFSRVPRMLRDLSVETGKTIELETVGETTEVDKGVIEKIGDPLTHMIRNAADHGLESTEERIAAGKSPAGTIKLSAEQKGARIFVRVQDNGRGINRERVKAKAIEKGIISADAVLSNEEIDQLICAPGFSTAETISNISGRGVGMDVVRSNVEALGGRVEIHSVPGEGTTFTMILPLTLAILDGMIVRLANQRFVLPLAHVLETVQPEAGQVKRTSPDSEVIDMRGEYVPVKRATEIFGLNDDRKVEDSLVVIVESEHGKVGLVVDTIDDRREVVIKSLDQNLHPIRGLGGATILGDGSIALILDIEALVASTNRYTPKGLAA